jgi:putative two-component system response regulator
VILCLARAAEYRDDDTGHHVVRVGLYAGIIARRLGLDRAAVELIEQAAQLHDVGKIGITDEILKKPGKLDPAEFECMKRHCEFGRNIIEPFADSEWKALRTHTSIGAKIMEPGTSPILVMATKIALTHHEKWDGSGYPEGLAGEAIPIEGRITAVADVFDALSHKRPYKPAFPLDKCLGVMEDGRGKHFDPIVLDAFFAGLDEVEGVRRHYLEG